MTLRKQIVLAGRRLSTAGMLAMATALVMMIATGEQAPLGPLAALTAFWAVITLAYQLVFYWLRLRRELQRARVVERPPEPLPYNTGSLPGWVAPVWIGIILFFGWALDSPFVGLFIGGAMLGYGLSAPVLAHRVARLERNSSVFYVVHNQQERRRELVRYIVR